MLCFCFLTEDGGELDSKIGSIVRFLLIVSSFSEDSFVFSFTLVADFNEESCCCSFSSDTRE